jgi:DNA-binding MarR family transcriptional regulator
MVPPPLRPGDWRLEVWRRFLHVHSLMMRQLEQETPIPLGWYDVLLQLAEAPDRRLRMAELAERVLLSRSGLTRLVDRLEAEGLVAREPSPADARGTYTVLRPAGADALRAAAPGHLTAVYEQFVARFSEDELREFGALLDRVAPPPPPA